MQNCPLVFSVTSGKGGVGKTNISVNLACALHKMGKRCLILDADLGLANVDVILGITPERNLFHLFHEGAKLQDILVKTEYGFSILPAASGVSEMLALTTGQKLELLEAVDVLDRDIDFLIVDTGAGINDNVLYFNLAVQERLVVLTPEPTSLTDAYALVKVMNAKHGVDRFRILVNMVADENEAKQVYTRLYKACDHFLSGISLDFVGHVPLDQHVRRAVASQVPFVAKFPDCSAAKALGEASNRIAHWNVTNRLDGNITFFWKQILFNT
ncbi:MAG: flagellar synthesis regulator FleN [Deltaproteobacteria bacterium]|nr:flagellar synthesis regulator FleN [Deltaproteobacteria bacterium]